MATGGSFPHASLQFPTGVHNIQLLKAQFERNKYTLILLEKRIKDLTREDKEENKNSIAQLKSQLTAVRGAQLAIKIELDYIDDQSLKVSNYGLGGLYVFKIELQVLT